MEREFRFSGPNFRGFFFLGGRVSVLMLRVWDFGLGIWPLGLGIKGNVGTHRSCGRSQTAFPREPFSRQPRRLASLECRRR